MGLLDKLWRPPAQAPAEDPRAAALRGLVPQCPVCEQSTAGHRFALVASVPIHEENEQPIHALYAHGQNHEWDRLSEFAEFRADQDDAMVYAMAGPHEGGLVILIRDPWDYMDSQVLFLQESLSADELDRVRPIPGETWHDM